MAAPAVAEEGADLGHGRSRPHVASLGLVVSRHSQDAEAEASFERMKKHYSDAVVLQDAKSLDGAGKDAEATQAALDSVKASLASTAEFAKQADDLLSQFGSIRSRDQQAYASILAATVGPSDDLMAQVGVLGKDNKALTDAIGEFDKAISASFQTPLDAVDAWSVRSRVTGLVMLAFVVLVCAMAWWVIQTKVVQPRCQQNLKSPANSGWHLRAGDRADSSQSDAVQNDSANLETLRGEQIPCCAKSRLQHHSDSDCRRPPSCLLGTDEYVECASWS